MVEVTTSYTGVDKAAILLLSLGEDDAAEILRHMDPKAVQKVGTAMAGLSNVSRHQVEGVLGEFIDMVEDQTSLGVGTDEYIRKVMVNALGEDKAGNLVDRILLGKNSKGLETLKWMDARAVADIIRLEHPQIIAIVLSYLDSDHSSEILQFLPENTRTDLIMRISTLDGIQPSALQELDKIMEKSFSGTTGNVKSSSVGGVKVAANMLNFMDSTIEAALIESIKDVDAELGQQIQDLMFVFDNLMDVDDKGIQSLLREVSNDVLIIALKGSDAGIRDKFFNNMSKRAAEMMREDLEAKGPVRLSDVESAQKEILTVARKLADSGDIVLGGKGAEEYV